MKDEVITKLEGAVDGLAEVVQMLREESGIAATESDNGLIVIPEGQRPPWTQIAEKFLGKNEIDDEDELREFLGFNPNDQDADGLAWCKGFVDSCHKKCGIEYPHSTLLATEYHTSDWGQVCDENTLYSLLIFQRKGSNAGHIGWRVEDDKILGGNQGDSVRLNNLAYYFKNYNLLSARWPSGYDLIV